MDIELVKKQEFAQFMRFINEINAQRKRDNFIFDDLIFEEDNDKLMEISANAFINLEKTLLLKEARKKRQLIALEEWKEMQEKNRKLCLNSCIGNNLISLMNGIIFCIVVECINCMSSLAMEHVMKETGRSVDYGKIISNRNLIMDISDELKKQAHNMEKPRYDLPIPKLI